MANSDEHIEQLQHTHLELRRVIPNLILELAFVAQDPAGEHALALARAVLRLICDRDDSDCVALTSELQALLLKYQPHTRKEPHDHYSNMPKQRGRS